MQTESQTRPITLPIELVSMIFDHFDESRDRQMLQAFSLVSRVWRDAAQARIFTHIEIENGIKCKFWSKKFKEFPHLGLLVRGLCLSDPDDDCMGRAYLRSRAAKALSLSLPRLKRLELEDIKRWGPVEQRLIKNFQSVQALSLCDIPGLSRRKHLPDLFYSLPNVCELIPGEVGEEYDEKVFGPIREAGLALRECLPEDGKPRILRELVLFDAELCIDKLLWLSGPAFDLTKLHSLDLSWRDFLDTETTPDFSPFDGFIQLVGEHVNDLYLSPPFPIFYEDLDTNDRLTMERNPADLLQVHLVSSGILRCFTAVARLTFTSCTIPLGVTDLTNTLKALVVPRLEVIQFVTGIEAHDSQVESVLGVMEGWQELDEILAGPAFPLLRLIEFEVNICLPAYPNWDIVRSVITHNLPKTVKKGLLTLKVTHVIYYS